MLFKILLLIAAALTALLMWFIASVYDEQKREAEEFEELLKELENLHE